MDTFNPEPFFDTSFFIWFGIGFLLTFIVDKVFKRKKSGGFISLILMSILLGIIGGFDDANQD